MNTEWHLPANHPIDIELAKKLIAGNLGNEYRSILKASCAPIFWHRFGTEKQTVLHSATITLIKTPKRLLGVTAAHVIRKYQQDHFDSPVKLQIMNMLFEEPEIIAISDELDLATLSISEDQLSQIGKHIVPLSMWPPMLPGEGRGIMLAGYPGDDRFYPSSGKVNFGLFTALGIARRVTGSQITWHADRDESVGNLPPNQNLGGISGGPLIGWFETANFLAYYAFCGIIKQAHQELENVVAGRADFIAEDGSINLQEGVLHL